MHPREGLLEGHRVLLEAILLAATLVEGHDPGEHVTAPHPEPRGVEGDAHVRLFRTQRLLGAHPVRDVDADAGHAQRRPVAIALHEPLGADPDDVAAGPDEPVLVVQRLLRVHRRADALLGRDDVVGVHDRAPRLERRRGVGRQAEELAELGGPGEPAGGDVPVPEPRAPAQLADGEQPEQLLLFVRRGTTRLACRRAAIQARTGARLRRGGRMTVFPVAQRTHGGRPLTPSACSRERPSHLRHESTPRRGPAGRIGRKKARASAG